MIYLDHNATTPVDERVVEAMLPFLGRFYGNPSALYRLGRLARTAIDMAREQVADLVDANPAHIVFTSGGTEANNIALNCLPDGGAYIYGATEHPSVLERIEHQVITESYCLSVDQEGLIQKDDLADRVRMQSDRPALLTVMTANNEQGVLQNIEHIAEQIGGRKIIFHSDAVQASGKIPLSFRRLGLDLMTLSSHKIYGPKGCGALVYHHKMVPRPVLFGGGQEHNWRPGTENVAAIVGFGKAAELAKADLNDRMMHLLHLRTLLEKGLQQISGIKIFALNAPRLANTVQFGIDGQHAEMIQMQLDNEGIAVSSGSACASGGGRPSHVLTAMGIEPRLAQSAIRVSLGKQNTVDDVQQLIKAIQQFVVNNRR